MSVGQSILLVIGIGLMFIIGLLSAILNRLGKLMTTKENEIQSKK
jgi:hypothetical protein